MLKSMDPEVRAVRLCCLAALGLNQAWPLGCRSHSAHVGRRALSRGRHAALPASHFLHAEVIYSVRLLRHWLPCAHRPTSGLRVMVQAWAGDGVSRCMRDLTLGGRAAAGAPAHGRGAGAAARRARAGAGLGHDVPQHGRLPPGAAARRRPSRRACRRRDSERHRQEQGAPLSQGVPGA